MGIAPDAEPDGQPNAAASGDNINGSNDEDGVINGADLILTSGQAQQVQIQVTNTTGTAGTLYGWIDYNDERGVRDWVSGRVCRCRTAQPTAR